MKLQYFVALVVLILGTVRDARAATNTWTGADPSGYWSAPGNWSPSGVPANGNALVFPGGLPPGDMVSTNDLAESIFRSITFGGASRYTIHGNPITLTNRANVIINDGTNVIACDLTFSGTPPLPTTGNPSIWSSSFGSTELTVIGNVGGGNLKVAVNFGRVVIRGQFTGGGLFVDWDSTLALYGDNPYAVSADVSGSTLLVQGAQPNLNIRMYWNMEAQTPAILSGDGVVGDVTALSSSTRITPDSTLSVENIGGPVTLLIHLNGTNVGEYSRLVASGNVSLSSGRLLPSAGFNPQAGQIFTIVQKTSPGPITGAFFGLPEGTITNLNGMPLRISYVGGDGNDVTLTVGTNERPVVTITNPPNAAVFPAPASFSLGASASDPDGGVTNVQFFRDGTSLGNDSSSPYSASVSLLAAGNYTLSAVASDNHGLRATNSIVVTVTGPPATTITWTGADPSGYWSAPANWSPAGVPTNGNDLVFPGGLPPGDMVSTNDLAGSFFRSITFSGASRHTLRGNPITLTNSSGVITSSGTNVIACDLILTATPSPSTSPWAWPRMNIFYPGELTVSGNIAGSSLNISGGQFVLRGQFPGGRLYAYGGRQAFYGDYPHSLSITNIGGIILVQGSQPNLNLTTLWEMESAACASLSASGAVGDIAGCGHITVDSTLSVNNLGHYGGWGGLDIRLNGTNVGQYGRVVVSGDVSLNYGSLFASAGFNPQAGQIFTIVEKTSPGAITNAPFGPEGTVTHLNGKPLRISYVGGDGNDVTLTVVTPIPIVLGPVQHSFGTQFVFSYSADVGLRYAVDRSATFSNWTTIRTNTATVNPMTVTDVATNGMNFYRVRLLPSP